MLNQKAEQFYTRHGAAVSEPTLESGGDYPGQRIMTTRHCIRYELDACPRYNRQALQIKEPFRLTVGRRQYRLSFDLDVLWQKFDLGRPRKNSG